MRDVPISNCEREFLLEIIADKKVDRQGPVTFSLTQYLSLLGMGWTAIRYMYWVDLPVSYIIRHIMTMETQDNRTMPWLARRLKV